MFLQVDPSTDAMVYYHGIIRCVFDSIDNMFFFYRVCNAILVWYNIVISILCLLLLYSIYNLKLDYVACD